jgi:hypothetical protein
MKGCNDDNNYEDSSNNNNNNNNNDDATESDVQEWRTSHLDGMKWIGL